MKTGEKNKEGWEVGAGAGAGGGGGGGGGRNGGRNGDLSSTEKGQREEIQEQGCLDHILELLAVELHDIRVDNSCLPPANRVLNPRCRIAKEQNRVKSLKQAIFFGKIGIQTVILGRDLHRRSVKPLRTSRLLPL